MNSIAMQRKIRKIPVLFCMLLKLYSLNLIIVFTGSIHGGGCDRKYVTTV